MYHCRYCKEPIHSLTTNNWRSRFCSTECQKAFDRARYLARKPRTLLEKEQAYERKRKAYRKKHPF